MKTILTIDFDILMHESANAYNGYNNGDVNTFIQDFPFFKYMPIDLDLYFQIMVFLTKIDKEKIIFINDHQEVIQHSPTDEKFHLINIDHHHDIGYDDEWQDTVDNLDCGNWVAMLWNLKRLEDYHWIADKKSEFPPPESVNFINKQTYIEDIENLEDEFLDVDKVIICLSPEWVPDHYIKLFDVLQYIIEYRE